MKNKIFLAFIFCALTGCIGGMGFVAKEKVFSNYYLVAPDDDIQLSLSYHEPTDGDIYGVFIGQTVFAVGYNEKYLIAKQHPYNRRNITNYFILPIVKGFNWKTNNGLLGPLTLQQFIEKRQELKISDSLKFSIVKGDLQ